MGRYLILGYLLAPLGIELPGLSLSLSLSLSLYTRIDICTYVNLLICVYVYIYTHHGATWSLFCEACLRYQLPDGRLYGQGARQKTAARAESEAGERSFCSRQAPATVSIIESTVDDRNPAWPHIAQYSKSLGIMVV